MNHGVTYTPLGYKLDPVYYLILDLKNLEATRHFSSFICVKFWTDVLLGMGHVQNSHLCIVYKEQLPVSETEE